MKQSTAKGSYAPKDELNKFGRCQRRFFPPVGSITCFSCHKPGHVVAHCKTKRINVNQQKMMQMRRIPQASKGKRQSFTRYTNHFHGYCYACNNFGHKSVECKMYSIRGTKYYTSAQMHLGQIRCSVCLKRGHKAKDCNLPYTLKNSRQMMECNQIKQRYE